MTAPAMMPSPASIDQRPLKYSIPSALIQAKLPPTLPPLVRKAQPVGLTDTTNSKPSEETQVRKVDRMTTSPLTIAPRVRPSTRCALSDLLTAASCAACGAYCTPVECWSRYCVTCSGGVTGGWPANTSPGAACCCANIFLLQSSQKVCPSCTTDPHC